MNKFTVGTYFSGGGIGLALIKDQVDLAFAVEYDAAISEVYKINSGENIITARVQDVDVTKLDRVDLFQVSPVCKEFSAAKTGGKESAEELGQAATICAYLDYHKPPYFLLENVRGYIRSKSFQMIVVKLSRLGYTCRFTVENSADYGVPQTRERLILRAALNRPLPSLPDYVGRWIGWYEAIEDLIPGLPESKFADWQIEKLPVEMTECLINTKDANSEWGKLYRTKDEPAITVTASTRNKAFIVGQDSKCTTRESKERLFTLTAEPNQEYIRAFIVPGGNTSNENYYRLENEPMVTISAQRSDSARPWLNQGKVVKMTTRALARFQSIPDWYKLPDKNNLACTVIGNGIPSLMGAGIIGALLKLEKTNVNTI